MAQLFATEIYTTIWTLPPDGTVRDEIERRRQKIAAAGGAESADIAGAIIEELLAESGQKERAEQ